MEYFSCRVHSVIFENAGRAFYILRVVLDGGDGGQTVIRGDIPGLKIGVGTWFGFEGVWDEHPQHGRQIRILRAPVMKGGWDAETSEKVLISNGVGPTVAAKLRAHFGEDMASSLTDPKKIAEVPGMTKLTALHVHSRWQAARAHFLALEFLNDLGLPQGRIRQIWAVFGDAAQEVLSQDPWSLVQIEGISFREADSVAVRMKLDTSATNPKRVRGAVLYTCRSGRGFGHLYSTSSEVLASVRMLDPDFKDEDIARAIKTLDDEDLLFVDRETQPGLTAIYDPWSYRIEEDSAEALRARMTSGCIPRHLEDTYVRALTGSDQPTLRLREAVDLALERLKANGSIALSSAQAEGVRNAVCEPVSIISGLPGTGKTTSLRVAVNLMQEAGINFLMVAPTGIAAKRASSVTGSPSYTIHRAFKARGVADDGDREATYAGVVGESDGGIGLDGSSEEWGYAPDRTHPAEVVIVDESSMVDQHLLYRIMTCTRPDARLVFVGDAAQLPSVGPGNVLRDLISSKMFPTVSLTEIFRQADTSPIVHAAHAIHRGDVPETPERSDFSLIETSDEEDVARFIVQAAGKLFEDRRYTFQVLSPRHAGTVGVTSLNSQLRERLNPKRSGLHEMRLGSEVIREDDRIMVVQNDYKLGVFNGDVGKVVTIDKKRKEIEIKIHGPPILQLRIPFHKAPLLLRLAYAVTVHKSQGQEYDVIVMPLVNSFAHQLQRNLLYTAVTRARKKVLLIGTRSALVRAVANERESSRNTLLKQRILVGAAHASDA